MSTSLQVLIVEDSEEDAELLRLNIERQGYQVACRRVETEAGLATALREQSWDLAITDYFLPQFSALSALAMLRERAPDLPIIAVSGLPSVELAVAAMKAGAQSYLGKDNLARLRPMLEDELREAGLRRARRQAEQSLRESEKRLRLFVDALQDYAIIVLDRSGRVVSWNPGAERIQGYQTEEILGRHFCEFYTQEEVEQGKPGQALKMAEVVGRFEEEAWRVRKDGSRFRANVVLSPLRDGRGQVSGFGEVICDVTARHEARPSLQREEEQYRLLSDNASDLVTVIDVHGVIRYESPSLERLFGYKPVELVGADAFTFIHPDDLPRVRERFAEFLGRSHPFGSPLEFRCRDRNGLWHMLEAIGTRTVDPASGEVIGVINSRDITERKRIEEEDEGELRRTHDRLRELSRRFFEMQETERRALAYGLHDEIGQALAVVKMNLETVRRFDDPSTPLRQGPSAPNRMQQLKATVGLVDGILEQLRRLTGDLRPPLLDDLGLVPALREYLKQQAQYTKARVEFQVNTSHQRLDSAVEMACFRAAEEGVANAMRHANAQIIAVEVRFEPEALRLWIRDDGVGINAECGVRNAEFRMAPQHSLLGWLGTQERISLVGGHLIRKPGRNGGTEVEAVFPLETKAEQGQEEDSRKE